MFPTLFQVGEATLPSYLGMLMLGFFAAVIVAKRDAKVFGVDATLIVDTCILMLVCGVVGARLLAVLTDGFLQDFIHLCTDPTKVDPVDSLVTLCRQDSDCGSHYLCNLAAQEEVVAGTRRSMCYPPRDCLATLKFWQGGLTFYGGILLAVPVGWWWSRRRNVALITLADILAPALLLALAFGRIGCFLNGCCYGGESDHAFAVVFPGHQVARHPTQFYECAFAFVLFVFLRQLGTTSGKRTGAALVGYGVFRLAIEALRGDPRGALGPLSTSQLISLPLVCVGVFLLWRSARR